MTSIYGDLLAAERIPVKLGLAGFSIVLHVKRDICSVKPNFNFAKFLFSRKKKAERSLAARQELRIEQRNAKREKKLTDIKDEMRSETKAMQKGRYVFLPPR